MFTLRDSADPKFGPLDPVGTFNPKIYRISLKMTKELLILCKCCQNDPKSYQKSAKVSQMASKVGRLEPQGLPRGAKGSQKAAKGPPNGAKREPKEPKGSQKECRNPPTLGRACENPYKGVNLPLGRRNPRKGQLKGVNLPPGHRNQERSA